MPNPTTTTILAQCIDANYEIHNANKIFKKLIAKQTFLAQVRFNHCTDNQTFAKYLGDIKQRIHFLEAPGLQF